MENNLNGFKVFQPDGDISLSQIKIDEDDEKNNNETKINENR